MHIFHTFVALITFSIATPIMAMDFPARMQEAYTRTDKNFDLDCVYTYNNTFQLITPVSKTIKGPDFIQREFILENSQRSVPMTFLVKKDDRSFNYTLTFDNKYKSENKIKNRDFQISPVNNREFAQEFETSKIYCQVNFAYAHPTPISDGNYHINVHPHVAYDWQNLLQETTERYLADSNYKSLILLETGNYRGNLVNIDSFLSNFDYKLPKTDYETNLVTVPSDIELIVSPAGNSRYQIKAENEMNITFTGGNHNYCIWNSSRWLIMGLMRSKTQAKLNLIYDTASIVAQPRGMEGIGINFPKRDVNHSNLLKDLLLNTKNSASYHANYLDFFKRILLARFTGMYKTVKINYEAEGFVRNEVIKGNGERELEINFIYTDSSL